ncbi:hypothetical protein Taro_041259 [Colocasia esculenta]|uniref:Peptidase A1 domain-containing protein n=1 Tax=Colocasia esculenta TaxID=4460 RepID=A0A843WB13_COLES|nr:hypothetical protein [Colocasia esculenta]
MASPCFPNLLVACLLLSLFYYPAVAQRPKALVLPVTKDAATSQYVTRVNQRTPLVPLDLVVDLGARYLWVDCEVGYVSSSYRRTRCRSAQCSLADSRGCTGNDVCLLSPHNPFIRTTMIGDLGWDVLAVNSTNGSTSTGISVVPQFLFSCAPEFLLQGLARGAKGIIALGKTRIALPSQLAAEFSFDRKFAICLSSSSSYPGVIFFGDGPYVIQPGVDVSRLLTYTPLITNPVSTAATYLLGDPSYEYFIGVKSIKVDEKRVPLNATLLSIDRDGVGGTKISTVDPYTVLETSIYNAVTEVFVQAAAERNITRMAAVAPFGVCFDAGTIRGSRVGAMVPTVDLVLQQESVYWRMWGANSMVQVRQDLLCLGLVDGGTRPRTSIVIGGRQLEDNLAMTQSTFLFLICTCYYLLLVAPQSAAQKQRALVLPVRKDAPTLQYVTTVRQRTPLVPLKLVVDLGGRYVWVLCDEPSYVSSSYTPARCRSARCSLAGASVCRNCGSKHRPGCNNDTCVVFPRNPFRGRNVAVGEVAADVLALQYWRNGSWLSPLPVSTVPQFVFSCAPRFLLDGLAAGTDGVAGLGRSLVALPSQLNAALSLQRRFGVCLSPNYDGIIYFGDGRDALNLFVGSAVTLTYTPLLTNPKNDALGAAPGEPSYGYFIGVTSVRINEKVVPLNATLLSIDKKTGVGGTKISTVVPYTVLETSIYRAVTEAFTREASSSGMAKVAPVAPFGACFDGKSMGFGREGAEVPTVDLVLQGERDYWRMLGGNTMVRAREGEEVWCLGFVDGGREARSAIVIGGLQLEDNLLEFDLAASTLGFSTTLLGFRTTCAGYFG